MQIINGKDEHGVAVQKMGTFEALPMLSLPEPAVDTLGSGDTLRKTEKQKIAEALALRESKARKASAPKEAPIAPVSLVTTSYGNDEVIETSLLSGDSEANAAKMADLSLERKRAAAKAILEDTKSYRVSRRLPESIRKARTLRRNGCVKKIFTLASAPMRKSRIPEIAQVEKPAPKKEDAPHWVLVDQPSADNHSWGNMLRGLGRDLTVSQCRDMGAMPNQRRVWTDRRGTVTNAK